MTSSSGPMARANRPSSPFEWRIASDFGAHPLRRRRLGAPLPGRARVKTRRDDAGDPGLLVIPDLRDRAPRASMVLAAPISRTRARIIEQCLETADALPFASRPYAALSGGEQRRVQFARVLAQIEAARTVHDRQALLLDEPVANLDLPHQLALLDAAKAAAQRGVAVLAVLHDLNLAARYGDALALMNKGAIVAYGDSSSVQNSDLLSEVFAVDLIVGTLLASEGPLVLPARWLIDT